MLRATALTTVGLALAFGFLRSSDLLLPGTAERDGIALAARVSGPTGQADGDWFYDSRLSSVRVDRESILIDSRAPGLQLISRILAVDPGRCYVAGADIATTQGASLAVMNGVADKIYHQQQVAATDMLERTQLRFVPESARITIAMFTESESAFILVRNGAVTPRPC